MTPEAERQLRLRTTALSLEKRNRPAVLPALAALVLLTSAAFAALSAGAAEKARSTLERSSRSQRSVAAQIEIYQRISKDQSKTHEQKNRYTPEPQMLSKLQGVYKSMGLTEGLTLREQGRGVKLNSDSSLMNKTVRAMLTNIPFKQAMEWVNRALGQIPGLYIKNIEFAPSVRGWTINVDLAHWELERS